MGKTTIHISCIDQQLVAIASPVLASGGQNESVVQFSFCPLWTDYTKVAVFYREGSTAYHATMEDDRCVIPHEVLTEEGYIYIGVFGQKGDTTRTSEVMRYRVVKGALVEGTVPSDPTPEIYAQILAACQEVLDGLDGRFNAVDERVEELARTVESGTEHEHDATHITSGTFPVERGGTGADNAKDARVNLGITLKNLGAAPANHTHDVGDMMSGQVPVSKGGTGADTAEGAREALGAVSKTGDTLNGDYVFVTDWEHENPIEIKRVFDDPEFTGTYTLNLGIAEDGEAVIRWGKDGDPFTAPFCNISLGEDGVWFSKPLGVEVGGTGARNAADALKNLGIIVSETEPENPTEGMIWIKVEPTEGA